MTLRAWAWAISGLGLALYLASCAREILRAGRDARARIEEAQTKAGAR